MRYLMIVTPTKQQGPVPPGMKAAMDQMMAESMKNGSLLDGGEFTGAATHGVVGLEAGTVSKITDGPFTEAKEAIGGYAILDYPTHEAALKGTEEFLALHAKHWPGWEGRVVMRQIKPHKGQH